MRAVKAITAEAIIAEAGPAIVEMEALVGVRGISFVKNAARSTCPDRVKSILSPKIGPISKGTIHKPRGQKWTKIRPKFDQT